MFVPPRFALDPEGKPIGVSINNECHISEMDITTDKVRNTQDTDKVSQH